MVGRTIASVEIHGPRTLRRHPPGPADFIARVVGRKVVAAHRRGKYLWLVLAEPATSAEGAGIAGERGWGPATSAEGAGMDAIIAHLGMSGQFLAVAPEVADQPHLRARFRFTDGPPEIRFVDQRTFGGLALDVVDDADGVPAPLAHIARDPLDPDFDDAAFTVAF